MTDPVTPFLSSPVPFSVPDTPFTELDETLPELEQSQESISTLNETSTTTGGSQQTNSSQISGFQSYTQTDSYTSLGQSIHNLHRGIGQRLSRLNEVELNLTSVQTPNLQSEMLTSESDDLTSTTGKLTSTVIWGTNVNLGETYDSFGKFFNEYVDTRTNLPFYPRVFEQMIEIECPYLRLDCQHLYSYDPDLYKKLVSYPEEVIPIMDHFLNERIKEFEKNNDDFFGNQDFGENEDFNENQDFNDNEEEKEQGKKKKQEQEQEQEKDLQTPFASMSTPQIGSNSENEKEIKKQTSTEEKEVIEEQKRIEIQLENENENENENNKEQEIEKQSIGSATMQIRPFNMHLNDVKSMRNLDPINIDQLVSINGMITRTTSVIPDLKSGFFQCKRCNFSTVGYVERGKIDEPVMCGNCGAKFSMNLIHNRSTFVDKQLIKMQENPDSIPEGETPQTVNLIVFDDLVDGVRPGDRVEVVGIFRASPVRINPRMRSVRSIYRTYIDVISFRTVRKGRVNVNYQNEKKDQKNLEKEKNGTLNLNNDESFEDPKIVELQKKRLTELGNKPNIYQLLTNSLAPSIFGMEDIKKGILCQLFSGSNKEFSQSGIGRFRPNINVLLVGDPGTSKSQMLQYVNKISPRGLYTSGKGSSIHYNQKIIIKSKETNQIFFKKIGKFIETQFNHLNKTKKEKILNKNSKIINFKPQRHFQILSVNKNGNVKWSNIKKMSKHKSPATLIKITTKSGRTTIGTYDHSFLTICQKTKKIISKFGSQLKIDDHVPIMCSFDLGSAKKTKSIKIDNNYFDLNENLGKQLGLKLKNKESLMIDANDLKSLIFAPLTFIKSLIENSFNKDIFKKNLQSNLKFNSKKLLKIVQILAARVCLKTRIIKNNILAIESFTNCNGCGNCPAYGDQITKLTEIQTNGDNKNNNNDNNNNYNDQEVNKYVYDLQVENETFMLQNLQFVHNSAVGLTAYVTKDPDSGEFVLESGALVLSDGGICCIDEFDKMSEYSRTVLHEAMEQQTVSVAKAGIIATLNARTSVLASANPKDSHYNPKLSVVDNIRLPPTLLSRFDLIYLVLDQPDENKDRKLARHIISLYCEDRFNEENIKANENEDEDEDENEKKKNNKKIEKKSQKEDEEEKISLDTLTDYISFAKNAYNPELTDEAVDHLVRGYVEMRQLGGGRNTITATPRQLESLIRISEAHAKIRLSNKVEVQDVKEAVRLVKGAIQIAATDPETGLIDMDLIATGRSQFSRKKIAQLATEIKFFLENDQGTQNDSIKFQKLWNQIQEQSTVEIPRGDLQDALILLTEENSITIKGSILQNCLIKRID
ncbi:intein-containing DNA replication licensing factor mcm4 precursor [Anaeramoeba flamelloides]|uniref:DNA helicase n=1 Tax=Anaeramoeba flamelloides TaxID=1746091 RepID=A0AAV8A664_9EUKA|nr:intein-containing DNA replication licensing factor mcm4 precursor [Anaeramoeba flamelloides]